MKGFPPKKDAWSGGDLEPVIANWVKAISLLHQNYNQLTSCVIWYSLRQRPSIESTAMGIGQCPIGEFLVLLDLFHAELEKLVLDIDTLAIKEQPDSFGAYKKLIDHTERLNQLNDRAQIQLHLASLPAS